MVVVGGIVRKDGQKVPSPGDEHPVEGERGRILLAIEAFSKKTQKTPPQLIDVAEKSVPSQLMWRSAEPELRCV